MRFLLISLLFLVSCGLQTAQEIHDAPVELHTYHCYTQCPLGQAVTSDLIVRNLYTISANDSTKMADWVAYRLSNDMFSSHNETNRIWKSDPWLEDEERLEPSDYEGAYEKLSTDRGHLAPLASFQSTEWWKETNYLSNIVPQPSALNRGAWLEIENNERQLAADGHDVYVLTGPAYDHSALALPKADEYHRVPSAFWKSILVFKDGVLISSRQYFFSDSGDYLVQNATSTISDIEAYTGLILYPGGVP